MASSATLLIPLLLAAGESTDPFAAYTNGDYQTSLAGFTAEALEHPDNPQALLNLGDAQYKLGDFEAAQKSFRRALEHADDKLQPELRYNLGNVAFRAQDYQRAAERYREALARSPGHERAKHNLELARRLLAQMQQQQQQQQREQDRDEGEEDQDDDSQPSAGEQREHQEGEEQPQQQSGNQDQSGAKEQEPDKEGASSEPQRRQGDGTQQDDGAREDQVGDQEDAAARPGTQRPGEPAHLTPEQADRLLRRIEDLSLGRPKPRRVQRPPQDW